MPIIRICDAIPMPPADTLESSSDTVQDCIHQYDHALFNRHANSTDYISSSERVFGILHCIKNTGTDIHAKIDNGAADLQIITKKGMISIIDVVIALGQRGIPFRGNWSGEEQQRMETLHSLLTERPNMTVI